MSSAGTCDPALRLFRAFGLRRHQFETLVKQAAGNPYTTVPLQDYSNSFASEHGRQALAEALPKRDLLPRRIQFPSNVGCPVRGSCSRRRAIS